MNKKIVDIDVNLYFKVDYINVEYIFDKNKK